MKNFINRLCTLLLVVALVLSGNAAFADNTEVVPENSFVPMTSQEFSALKGMNLLTDTLVNASANSTVTRAEFLGALFKITGYSEIITMEEPFVDVDSATPHYDAVSFFYNTGVIKGTSSTTFSPYNTISCRQAVTVLINFLGYRTTSRVKSNSESEYLETAYKYGLLKGVKADSFDRPLTAETAVVLLYNCATADLVEVSSYNGNGEATIHIDKDSCILTDYHSIYYGRGIIGVSVNGELQLEEKISIDGKVYFTGGKDFSEYLGYKVKFFYKADGSDRTLLWVNPEAVNSVLTIDSEDLLINDREYNYDKIIYKGKGEKRTEARVNSYADIVYNYALCNNATLDMIKPKVGNITLVDNNNDAIYDTVVIREYQNLFVYGTSLDENFIADRYGNPVDLDDYKFVKIIKNGEEIQIGNINNNCVVSYLASPDKKYLYLYVNDAGVKEKLVSVTTEPDETMYEFESGEYFVSKTLDQVIADGNYFVPELSPGKTYWYYLDVTGRIAAVTEANDDTEQYAYLIEIHEPVSSRSRGKVDLELVLKDGTQTFIETAKEITIDGVEDLPGTTLSLGEVGEVVKLSFNKDGEVKSIDFADSLDETAHPFGFDKTNFTLDYPEINELYYRNYLFGNRYAIGADTVCFAVFTNKDGTKEYDVIAMNAIPSNATYTNLMMYDCDEYRNIGALVIPLNRRDRFFSGHILVDNVRYVLDEEDDEYYTQIVGLVGGKEVSYTVKDEDEVLEGMSLKRGDVIRCSTYENVVYRVELLCRLSNEDSPLIDTTILGSQSDSKVFGYLYSNDGNNIVLYNPDGWKYGGKLLVTRAITPLANLSISVYDKKTDTVYTGSAKDLYNTSAPQLDGSIFLEEHATKVFIWRENTTVGEIIVAHY